MTHNVVLLYSHTDEVWKNELQKHIQALINAGHDLAVDPWDERRLDAEKDWFTALESAFDRAGVIILLTSKDFLNHRFMQSDKVRKRLKEKQEGGFPIFIVMVNKCEWKRFSWMKELFILPGEGKSLSDLGDPAVKSALAELTRQIAKALNLEQVSEGMLAYLQINEVGPVRELSFEPNRRLNIITGDNSLGKTFLLECAWWILAGKWLKYQALPREDAAKDDVRIVFQLMTKSGVKGENETIFYDWKLQSWPRTGRSKSSPGLVIYARVDGSFAVWDPVTGKIPPPERASLPNSPLFFNIADVENGIFEAISEKETRFLCNGLIADWVNWQKTPGSPFGVFEEILDRLSSSSQDPLKPGKPVRIPGDSRQIPSLIYPYGIVPFVHTAASVKRIISLAYLMLWTWEEHKIACELTKEPVYKSMVVLIDEVESHLHPQWQRSIIPSLLEVKKSLHHELDIQFLLTTHSPLVLAASEPIYDEEIDKLFHLDIRGDQVALDEQLFLRHGRVDNWFTSDTFGLRQARSLEAEKTIEDAKSLQLKENPTKEEVEEVHNRLLLLLGDFDTFWPRWLYFAEQHGVEV